ncbi:MAG: DegT/DnrJ/EryC1/StrS family aminotransferase [Chloroflexota bacterium]
MLPFLDLQQQTQQLRGEIEAAIAGVLDRGMFILGDEVRAFENEFAAACGVGHAAGVASGTDALQLALRALGVGPGDEVITVSHTAVATVAAIELVGARPVFVDIDRQRYTLAPEGLPAAYTPHTRAIIPVHLYGCPADLDPILHFARRHALWIVEDCAQAHGAQYHGRPIGSWGHAAAFSFYPTKNLGALGDGGAVVTNDPALADRIRLLRRHGWQPRYISQEKGMNSCLDELQAAILRVKLRHLSQWNAQRRRLARRYTHYLCDDNLNLPVEPDGCRHVYHQYVIRHDRRDALRDFLEAQGIGTLVHYPVPVHLQPAYRSLGYREGSLPVSEAAARQVLSLPIYPGLHAANVQRVCRAIVAFAGTAQKRRQG